MEGTKEERDKFVTRLDVLDKVKKLNTIPGVNHLTVNQVANFYEVESNAIRTVIERHREELESDGLIKVNQKELLEQVAQYVSVVNTMTFKLLRYEDEEVKISNFGVNLFPKRAVLRIEMLLIDSPVTKEVRTLLLNVYHDVGQGKEDVIENINKENSQEGELILEKVKA